MAGSLNEPEVFAELVSRHASALHAFLSRRTRVVDDVLAESWLVAFRRRRDFDPAIAPFKGWLFGIARTTLLAQQRRSREEAARPYRVSAVVDLVDDGGWDEVDARLDAQACGPRLRAALLALPAVERDILLLVAWDGLSPTEAAAVLGIPPGTARSRLHRARQALQTSEVARVAGEHFMEEEAHD